MKKLPLYADDEEVLSLVRQWVEHLAKRDYTQAMALLSQGERYAFWTPALVEERISSYGPPEGGDKDSISRVTPPGSAQVYDIKPRHSVDWYDPELKEEGEVVGVVHFDLPINGVWSDLTAILNIEKGHDFLSLELEDIHVL
ncbi:MAG: hypothetical protein WBP93_17190 [Pyrinomonadaceae bacterium]